MGTTWFVEYHDGSMVTEARGARMGEVDWDRAGRVIFGSPAGVCQIALPAAPAGLAWSLRRRVFAAGDRRLEVMMLVLARAGDPPGPGSIRYCLYWLEDDQLHKCPHFDCPEVALYAHRRLRGHPDLPLAASCPNLG